jgi:trk system potassium uptake protein TrkH
LTGVQLLAASFLGLIAVGTVGLLLLPGLYTGDPLGVVDALFTATSAVCVTGLIVVDTATHFSPAGQAWIAVLIQLGGLGIVVFAALILSLLGGRASVGTEQAAGAEAAALARIDTRSLVRTIVVATFAVEAGGAVILWALWAPRFGPAAAIWPAIFHAISAFCNAGFSTFSDSLVGLRGSLPSLAVMGTLIVSGGLGFVVVWDLRTWYVRGRVHRVTLHTRLVVGSTIMLLIGGTVLYLLFEWRHALGALAWPARLWNALFMSVTARTAGFNTVDYDTLSNPSMFLTVLLMLVGGSPGSTAGGLKTTTVALLALLLVSRLRGHRRVSLGWRTIPQETVERAAGLALAGIALLGVCVFLLLMTELPAEVADRTHLARVVFEAHSAFGTVGLSMGATPQLSTAGKLIVTFLMFLGRIGPLTLAASMALSGRRRRVRFRYAHEDVVIG